MDKKAKILATLGPAIFKKNIINNDPFFLPESHELLLSFKFIKQASK